MSLQAHNLTKRFGAVVALNDLSITLKPGAALGIVGDNGAGKSTLLNILSGNVTPDHGHLHIHDRNVTLRDAYHASQLGIELVSQKLSLCDELSIVENLFLGRELHTGGWLHKTDMIQRARPALEALGLAIDLHTKVKQLSGGERQLVALARTQLFDPSIILYDEPTAAVSMKKIPHVLAHIQQQTQHNKSIVLVSHRLTDVFAVCDHILLLRQGQQHELFKTGDIHPQQLIALL